MMNLYELQWDIKGNFWYTPDGQNVKTRIEKLEEEIAEKKDYIMCLEEEIAEKEDYIMCLEDDIQGVPEFHRYLSMRGE